MRPRKVILNVDHDADRRGWQSFRLDVWGYRVLQAESAEEALAILRSRNAFAIRPGVDLVLVQHGLGPKRRGLELVAEIKRRHAALPCLVVSDELLARDCEAEAFLPANGQSGWELRERVRLLAARKRGPRRGWNAQAKAPLDDAIDPGRKPPRSVEATGVFERMEA